MENPSKSDEKPQEDRLIARIRFKRSVEILRQKVAEASNSHLKDLNDWDSYWIKTLYEHLFELNSATSPKFTRTPLNLDEIDPRLKKSLVFAMEKLSHEEIEMILNLLNFDPAAPIVIVSESLRETDKSRHLIEKIWNKVFDILEFPNVRYLKVKNILNSYIKGILPEIFNQNKSSRKDYLHLKWDEFSYIKCDSMLVDYDFLKESKWSYEGNLELFGWIHGSWIVIGVTENTIKELIKVNKEYENTSFDYNLAYLGDCKWLNFKYFFWETIANKMINGMLRNWELNFGKVLHNYEIKSH